MRNEWKNEWKVLLLISFCFSSSSPPRWWWWWWIKQDICSSWNQDTFSFSSEPTSHLPYWVPPSCTWSKFWNKTCCQTRQNVDQVKQNALFKLVKAKQRIGMNVGDWELEWIESPILSKDAVLLDPQTPLTSLIYIGVLRNLFAIHRVGFEDEVRRRKEENNKWQKPGATKSNHIAQSFTQVCFMGSSRQKLAYCVGPYVVVLPYHTIPCHTIGSQQQLILLTYSKRAQFN